MKRFAAVVLAAVMCAVFMCTFAFTAFAESTAYEIDELNMSIPVPDDMLVITRDSKENDPFFKTFKIDYNTAMAKLDSSNIYLQATTKDSALTLTVTMTVSEDSKKIGSYNDLSDEELTNIMKKLRENDEYKDASPVEYKDVKYICLNMTVKDGKKTIHAQQYNTVMNGENICVTLSAASGKKLTAANKELLADTMKETSILDDTFFNRNKDFIFYGIITLAAIAIVVTAFILLLKYFRNPNRKHKILVHELAHEHKITETTQIPRKHILSLTKPTNTFLTKYAPVGEIGKRKKKQPEVIADETNEIRSYSEPAPEEAVQEEPVTSVTYEDAEDEIVVPATAEEISGTAAQADADTTEDVPVQSEEPAQQTADAEPEEEAQTEQAAEEAQGEAPQEAEDEQVDISELIGDVPVEEAEQEPQPAVQSEREFDDTADYFDVDPEEGEMFSYADVDTAVDDYSKAKKRRLEINEDEENENIPRAWDTTKRVFAAIGRGIVVVFKAIFTGIVFGVTHFKYFCINMHRMIKRKRAASKRRKAEEQRRREASERRRMQREAERARQRNNANRGANDLVQVRSSYDRGPAPQPTSRQRVDSRQRADRQRRAEDYRVRPQRRSDSQRRR